MQTVIGVFDERETAQRAVERLVQSGVPRADVQVQDGGSITAAQGLDHASTGGGEGSTEDRAVLSSIGHVFSSLLGVDNPSGHVGSYAEAVRRGSTVVVVRAADGQQAERSASLLHELGAINIDERVSEWRAAGWTGSLEADPPATGTGATDKPGRF